MENQQNNTKPVEANYWVVQMLGRVVAFLNSIEGEDMCNPSWVWKCEDLAIAGICTSLQGYILTSKGAIIAPQIAGLNIDKAKQYAAFYGVSKVCELVKFAQSITPKKPQRSSTKSIENFILADDKKRVKSALRKFLNNKQGKDCAITIAVFMDKGYLKKPTFSVLQNEFNINTSKQAFNSALAKNPKSYYSSDFNAIKQALENQYPNL